ncbi:nuclease-related domain-containing protein [Sporosarcina limicola]|uniref:NERD domain-containing protein n=1 Tax=Sporosarcina limicola TaxID=34101 RepID=A0A927MET3_9BACL|nr:nuclease-related domain-containing protein [Sporosarcina limicola]MBE1553250.1 hypothetical protein [Sporosarcina limicola]
MIIKNKSLSYKRIGLEALIRRLPESHSRLKEVERGLRIVRAGENGEKILTNVFQKYRFQNEHYILHDLNLKSTGLFQIDTLFLSRHGAVILEMKNIAGRISFPEKQNQLVRTLENGQVDAFECPSIQLERNMMLLEDWFHTRHLSIPISGAVVFPKPQQQFENIRGHMKILFPLEIPVYLRKIEATPPTLDATTLQSVAKNLANAHQEYNPFPICKTYNIDAAQLITGVRCEVCDLHGMQPIFKGWVCAGCKQVSREAHLQAFLEYFMLINCTMTNRECREFLHLSNTNKTTRLMKQMNALPQGKNKGRVYEMRLQEIAQLYTQLQK